MPELLEQLGYDRRRIAVEVNRGGRAPRRGTPSSRLSRRRRASRSSPWSAAAPASRAAGRQAAGRSASSRFRSRLITGTGKYASYDLMRDCLAASGCEVTTVAVRRERLVDKQGRNILDFLDLKRYTILPNTAGCFSAEDAIRHARLARELLDQPRQPRRRLGQAGMPGRPEDAAARPGGHAAGDRAAGQGRLPGAGLHQRRPDHGPAAEGGRARPA